MKHATLVLLVLALVAAAPVALADPLPDPLPEPIPVEALAKCIDVNPNSPNPVLVYDC